MEEQVTEVEKNVPAGSNTMERCIKTHFSDNALAPRPSKNLPPRVKRSVIIFKKVSEFRHYPI